MQRTKKRKKNWIWPGPALVASAAAPPAAAVGERAAAPLAELPAATPLAEPRRLRAVRGDATAKRERAGDVRGERTQGIRGKDRACCLLEVGCTT